MFLMTFEIWLDEQLDKRGWNRSDLARKGNFNPSALSNIYTGRRKPGIDICNAIAAALKLPPEEVYREAGLLPAVTNQLQEDEKMMRFKFNLLKHKDSRDRAIRFLEFLAEEEERENSHAKTRRISPSEQRT